ncbi:transcriptional repressor ILP1-like isoform X2 [Hibiscus syriacus]|uniref:transcriptional repressor ILP1-like isoform X2 n=1 Tax=Hibiscus syriacus TaxID=106335 RepID=UPI001921DCFD|nr:transcriptional repressor ILP1-like isoform X2 [Hibiscus syriacus]
MSSVTRARNFRRRGDDAEEDDSGKDNSNNPTTATQNPSSSKPAAKKPPKLLSFADDENEEETTKSSSNKNRDKERGKPISSRFPKPSSAHKITTVKGRKNPSSSSLPSNVQPQAGTYTKEALLELQKNTRTLAAPSSRPTPVSSEPKIVLKGLLKPQSQNSNSQQENVPTQKLDKDDTESRLATMAIGKEVDLDSSVFPDQATIDSIKAKKDRARKSFGRPAPDYISLDGGSNHGGMEELSDEEELEFRGLLFGESGKKGVFEVEERAMGVVSRKDEIHDEENDDEEEKLWEEEQFRKGLGKRLDDGSNRVVISSSTTAGVAMAHNMPQQHQKRFGYLTIASYGSVVPNVSPALPSSIVGAAGASQGLDVPSISQQAEIARKALQENVIRLKESHARTISSLTKADENLSASLFNITALEKSLSAAGEKFIFMQKLRDFVSVICEFLQHKAPLIEELEERMQKLNEKRTLVVLERRTADNDDEIVEVEAAVKAAMLVFSERGSSAAMIEVATNAAQSASGAVKEQANLPVKLDEFGRDVNRQKRLDMERRAEARHRRKARFDSKRLSSMDIDSSYQKIEGESSTDESDSESTAYQSNRDLLLQTADQVFSDASEEYSQLSAVKQKFEKLKKDYSSSYRDAYMSLSIPAIFSPYVRLELLKWDPLHRDEDFSDMKWHNLLFNYGFPEDGNFASDDADANLVPALVEKIALPVLHHEISYCWDMLSSQETKNAVSATSLIIDYVPASSEALAELLVTIRTRLKEAVTDIMVPTWTPLVMKVVPNAARVTAYRFGMSVRLMRNICLWKDILALPVLEKLALDELLCGKILPHIRCITSDVHDAVTRTERIVASLSGLWTGTNVSRDSSKLQPLVDCVLSLGKALERRHTSGVSEGEAGGLARRLKKILVELNEFDNARDIARRFHLKEAL